MNLTLVNWIIIAIGTGITIDGVGSALLQHGQFHSVWFDGERYIRAAAGVVLVLIGLFFAG